MSKMLWFSESLQKDLANDVFQSKFRWGHNLSFFAIGPWAIGQIGKYFYLSNMNFDDTIWKVFF